VPPLPHPDEARALLADSNLLPEQQSTLLQGCALYWGGPRRVDLLDPLSWRKQMADNLLVGAAQAIFANILDPSAQARLPWESLHRWLGPLPPGEVWTIGAREGGGKTTFLLNWLNALYSTNTPFTLLPLEQGADEILRKLAALRTATPYAQLVRGDPSITDRDFARVNTEVRQIAETLNAQGSLLVPDRRLSPAVLHLSLERAAVLGHQLVLVDHIHRLDITSGRDEQALLIALMRLAKDAAYRLGLSVVFTAQLNRADPSRLAPFHPPKMSDFRGSQVLSMESDVMLGLWRPMRPLSPKLTRAVEAGDREPREFLIRHRMATVCLKHRRDDSAFMQQVRLFVQDGVIRDCTPFEAASLDEPGPVIPSARIVENRELFPRGDACEDK